MTSTIEELFYGNITPSERGIRRGSEYAHILSLVARHEETLGNALASEQKEVFEKFRDCVTEMNSLNEVNAFSMGFKLGLRLTAESFITGNSDHEPIS